MVILRVFGTQEREIVVIVAVEGRAEWQDFVVDLAASS